MISFSHPIIKLIKISGHSFYTGRVYTHIPPPEFALCEGLRPPRDPYGLPNQQGSFSIYLKLGLYQIFGDGIFYPLLTAIRK